jgi:hypothetical protein
VIKWSSPGRARIGGQGRVGKEQGEGTREGGEENWGGQGERAKGRWGEGTGMVDSEGLGWAREVGQGGQGERGEVSSSTNFHLGRAKVWSIIIGHPYLCVA